MNTSSNLQHNDFWRICVNQNQCHCDYRVTLQDCEEHVAYLYINYVSLAWSSLSCILILGVIGWRVGYRGQKIIEMHGFFPRPKPIESLGLFGGLSNFARMIHSILLVTDAARFPTFRLLVFDFAWQLGFTAFTCYLVGVSHTLAVSNQTIYKAWVRSPAFVDGFCVVTILLPFVVPTIFNVLSGVYGTQGKMDLAEKYTAINYYCWGAFAFLLTILIMFAGIRLVNLLNEHLSSQLNRHNNMAKIKTGALKVKITMLAACGTVGALAIIAFIYAAARTSITLYPPYGIALAVIVNYIGPAAATVICLAVLLNPTILTNIGFWSFGSFSENQSQTLPLEPSHHECVPIERQFYIDIQDLKDKMYLEESDDTNNNRLDSPTDQKKYNDSIYIRNHSIPLEYTRRFSFYQLPTATDTKVDRLETPASLQSYD
ncbi:unnamed protein product [Absidia cylindrospora]